MAWYGWFFVENCLLAICSFQLGFWNYLDFIMVCGGILDLWLLPLDSDMALPPRATG